MHMHVHIYKYTYAYGYASTCMHAYAYAYMCICMCMHACMHMHMHMHPYAWMHMHPYAWMHMHAYICMSWKDFVIRKGFWRPIKINDEPQIISNQVSWLITSAFDYITFKSYASRKKRTERKLVERKVRGICLNW